MEQLEDRALLAAVSLNGSPQSIPVGNFTAGQEVPLLLNFTTTDSTTPEQIENEWVQILGSTGYRMQVPNYGQSTVLFPITVSGETISAWIDGYDGDESATLQAVDGAVQIGGPGTADNITLYNPPSSTEPYTQTIPVTVSNLSSVAATYNLSVQQAPGGTGMVTLSQTSVSLGAGQSTTVTATPTAVSSKPNDVEIAADYQGLPIAEDSMTVVSVTIPQQIRNADTPPSMTADRIPNSAETYFSGDGATGSSGPEVTVTPNLTGSNQSVTLVVDNQSTNNGTVSIDGNGAEQPWTIENTDALPLSGVMQTAPAYSLPSGFTNLNPAQVLAATYQNPNAGQLKLGVQVHGSETITSAGFSVAAIPISVTAAQPTPLNPGQGILGGQYVITWQSDSGNPADLGQIALSEQVERVSATGFLQVSPFLQPLLKLANSGYQAGVAGLMAAGQFADSNAFPIPPANSSGVSVDDQTFEFLDARTGSLDVPVTDSGYEIIKRFTSGLNVVTWDVTRAPIATEASGITASAGIQVGSGDTGWHNYLLPAPKGANDSVLSADSDGNDYNVSGPVAADAADPGPQQARLDISGTASPDVTATQLVVTTQPPSSVSAGSTFGLVVKAEDGSGDVDTSFTGSVTLSDDSQTLEGTTTVSAVAGVATFSGLSLDFAETDSLDASASGLSDGTTHDITVTATTANKVAFDPADIGPFVAASPFSVYAEVEDRYGNLVGSFNGNVTLALGQNPSNATLGGTVTVAASSGYVDFSGITISKIGTNYTLTASGTSLSSATSDFFNVTYELVMTTQPPSTVTAGSPFGLVVKAEDGAGNVDTSFSGSVTVTALEPLYGTTTVTAVSGVATFSGLSIDLGGDDYVYANATGLATGYSDLFDVVGGPATHFVFQTIGTTPAAWEFGTPFVTPGTPFSVAVNAADQYGNTDPNFSGSVTVALANNPSGATLGGTLTATASEGLAEFSNLTLNKSGRGYTMSAAGESMTGTSAAFDAADQLAITTAAPSTITAGTPFGLTVAAENSSGTVDTSFNGNVSITLTSFSDLPTDVLQGQLTATAVNGVATFSGLTIDQAGDDDLVLTGSDLTFTSQLMMVNPGTATQLVVTSQPPLVTAGTPFSIDVSAEDAFGNLDSPYSGNFYNGMAGYNGNVTIALLNNPGGATLSGTLTATASGGLATFSGLSINNADSGYTLQVTASGLSSGTSAPLNVTAPGVATQLVVTSAALPTPIAAGTTFGLTVKAEDNFGTVATSFDGTVTVSLPNNNYGGTLGGTLTATAVNGVATFSGLSFQTPYFPTWLDVSANGLAMGATNAVDVVAAAATQLVVASPVGSTLPPYGFGNVLAGTPFSVTVYAEDPDGNEDPNFDSTLTLALANNPSGATLGGTLTATAQEGIAVFSGLTLSKAGSGYTLQVSGGGLPTGTSAAFSVGNDQLVASSPPTITAGSDFGLTVQAENGSGVVDSSFNGPVTVGLVNLGGNNATLGGTLTVDAVDGVAAFSGLALNQVGSYALSLSAAGVPAASTSPFSVAASQLAISTQPPADVTTGAAFSLTVAAVDPTGDVDPTFNGPVTLALANNPGGATLGGTLTATASNGVATFTNVSISNAGSGYTLQATALGLASSTTNAITVVAAGTATALVLTSAPPSSVTAGSPFGLAVTAEGPQGNVVSSFNGSVTIANAGGLLNGTLTVTAVNGVATFSGLSIDLAAPYYVLDATAAGLTGAATGYIAVTPAAATHLVVPAPSANILTGAPFTLAVSAEDPYGNVASNFHGNVTLALGANPGGATLGGTLTVTAASGVATFSGLSISAPGNGYTLRATVSGLAAGTGPLLTVTNDQLVVTTEPPSSVAAGSPFGLVVEAENGAGAVDTTFNGSVAVMNLGGAFDNPALEAALNGSTTVTAVSGVATFSGLTLAQAGVGNWLIAVGNGLPLAATNTFDVVPGTASQLVVTTAPPSNVSTNAPFAIDVSVEDGQGNVNTAYNGNLTLALLNNPGSATLGGTLTVAAVDGVAAFPGLSLNKPDSGYTLKATASGLTSATTTAIDVTAAGVATQLVVTVQPPSSFAAGASFGLTVKAEDSFGTVVTTFHGSVTLSSLSGATLGGTLTVTAVNGVATFSSLTDDQAGSGNALSATSTGLDPATTNAFTVSPLAANQLAVLGPGVNVLPGSVFGMTMLAEDQYDNLNPSFSGNVTLALSSNPGSATLSGTLTAAAADGLADFANLSINNVGNGYTLQAQGAGLSGTSAAFDATADQLVVTSQPPAGVYSGFGFGLTVAAENASGVVDTSFTGSVTLALLDPEDAGGTLGGTLTATAVSGAATFSGLNVNKAGYYLLSASGNNVGGALSQTVTVVTAVPGLTLITPSPLTYSAGQSVTIQWTAAITAGDSGSINLAYAPNATAWSPNATWLYNVATAADGAGSYAWNTAGLAGTYYLSGYLWDATAGVPYYNELYTTPVVIQAADSFALSTPSPLTYTAGQNVTIQWTEGIIAGHSGSINLAYAPNATAWSPNATWIYNVTTAADGTASYAWNTSGVAAGTYYLSGYLWDATAGAPYYSELYTTPVIIQAGDSFTLSTPSPLTYMTGQSVTIQWTESIIAGHSGSINLAYAPNATAWSPNATWFYDVATAADGTGSYAWNTTGVAAGTYYLSGYFWDATAGQPLYSELYTTPVVIQAGDSFTLSTPSPLTYIAGQNVTIQWTESIIAGHSGSINLAYAPNATAWSPNATWFYNVATAGNGTASYTWNTTGVAAGTYYLSGYFWDATAGQPLYSELYTTPIVIQAGDSFTLSTPSPLTYIAGQNVTIRWTESIIAGHSGSINLAYAPNATAWSPNATWFYNVATAGNGTASYTWNTTGVAAGTYYLSGYFWDATAGEPLYSELYTTPVVIQPGDSFALSTPSPLTYIAGQNVTIQWTESIIAGHSGSINLAYAPNATAWSPNAHWMYNVATAADGTASYAWNTTGVAAGTYYLSGYLWDATAGEPLYSELYTTPIVIQPGDSFALSTPSPLTYTPGQDVTIQWTMGIIPGHSGSINLAYAPNATAWSPNAHWTYNVATAANGTGTYLWNTTGVAAGTYYLSGYLWDATAGEPLYSELYTTPVVIT